jgi:hypothetical protein
MISDFGVDILGRKRSSKGEVKLIDTKLKGAVRSCASGDRLGRSWGQNSVSVSLKVVAQ